MSIARLRNLVRWGGLCGLLLVATGGPAFSADPGLARLETYTPSNGDGYFALSLVPAPSAKPTEGVGHDVLVVVDTSASQVNRFRDKSLEALEFFLSSLGPNDRVQLAAVDLNFIPLTKSFVAPQGPEVSQALTELRARTPLATTDMAAMLKASAEAFAGEVGADRVRAVAYIGDGMSAGNLLASGEMQTLVDALVAKRIAVSSFAVGPRLDLQLLGVLANHTGGLLVVDQDDPNGATINGKQAGNLLAQAATGAVVWPVKPAFPASFKEAFPKNLPPLRFDRDTIVVGVGTFSGPVELSVAAELQGKPTQLSWSTEAISAADDHAYLPELIAKIRTDGGITLPTVGSAGLGALRSLAFAEAYQLLNLSKQAATVGNYDEAQRMVDEALRLDPNNGETQAVRLAIQKAKADGKGRGPRELKLVNFQPQPAGEAVPAVAAPALEPVSGATNDEDAQAGSLLQDASKNRKVIIELVTTEVQNGLNEARGIMGRSPDAARATLKALVDKVQGVPELDGAVKSQLLEQIQTALRTAERQAKVEEERRIQREAVIARQQEQDRLYRDLMVGQQKTEQLMARFENLMDERRYRDAMNLAEQAAQISDRQAPRAAVTNSSMKDLYEKHYTLQRQKNQGFGDAVYGIERSGVPFADEPPIVYPAKEVWEMLTERRAKWNRVDVSTSNEAEIRIREELEKKTDVQYLETQLGDVVTDLKLRHKINIELDTEALAADGKGSETPITKTLKDVSLRSALRLILEGQGLTYLVKNEVMLITTKAAASSPENLETRVYPVADLVVPIPKGGLSGFGGLGGGSTMSGGMGGGMGGGGMGGGGMGGGGMGGGGGGGGFFAVEDELRLSGPTAKTAPATFAPAAAAPTPANDVAVPAAVEAPTAVVQPIRLKLEPNADVERAWDEHFAAREESSAAVRTTVRVLMKEQQPRQAAAVIMAAIKHHQAQPWMYEALGLAMEMQGSRVGEIERALMSAVDFSTQPDDLMHVAEYMVKSNLAGGHLQKRALELYRQVARMQPTRPEPYVLGLRIARHLDDAEGMKWATLGILAQAWTGEQRIVFDEAHRVANALLEKLRVEKRTAEADAFQAAVKGALVRDCVINVSWSGDADVDLVVEEPAGTLCSFRTPRTTSGGVLIGDAFDKSTNLHTETYVCPQGFNGDYRMLAKRVWGKVTADTLTVEVIAHAGSDKERRIRKQINLQDDQAAMAFDMQNARRTEALKDVQVVNAVQGQLALNQQMLAQQLSLANDPRLMYGANPLANPRMLLRGAVGYQPVIITLPTGANMSMVAVVSHDRRYVRVSPQPMFSTIPSVNTFNYSSGSSGTSGGANNGPS